MSNCNHLLSEEDLIQLSELGISKSTVESQLRSFKEGFPFLEVLSAATIGNGIKSFSAEELKTFIQLWEAELQHANRTIVKFVPASGAASRMFKSLYEYLSQIEEEEVPTPPTGEAQTFFEHLNDFAFDNALNAMCLQNNWKTMAKLHQQGEYKQILENFLLEEGLNYGNLPKGLLLFHNYKQGARTAAEEHLAEGAMYTKNVSGDVFIHFTVSPEHLSAFKALLSRKVAVLEDVFSVRFHLSYSTQKKETDTIAVDENNNPLRDSNGRLLFRPGGHGALIENLNDIDADIIFIKNIDNVVPDHYKCDTIIYKKALGGYLVSIRDRVYDYMRMLSDVKRIQPTTLFEIQQFITETFGIQLTPLEGLELTEVAERLKVILNRPMRVCGMVRNEGEPGGGPYIVRDEKGFTSLQILESTQINKENPAELEIMKSAEFFNPVDLVCCVKDFEGHKFNLRPFIDEHTGFISHKSKDGIALKALELPGLWNGAMAKWNTAFVEVPISTFNPVKTVSDLLRPMHQ